jgi:drug/metabolite transporter (DMT)-like permease
LSAPAGGGGAEPRFVHLQMHVLVLLFSSTAVLGALISLPAPVLVVWRTAIAAVAGGLLAVLLMRLRLFGPGPRIPALLAIGAIIGVHWMTFFGAIRVANISIALAGLATTSFFTAFTEPWIEKRRVRSLEVWLGLLVLAGLLLVAGFERGRLTGLLLALSSAFLAAVFPVLNRRLVHQPGMEPQVMIVWEMVGACLTALAALPLLHHVVPGGGPGPWSGLFAWQGFDWVWLLVLALVCTVFAHGFHIHLLRHLSAYAGNLANNLEPVYGILAAAVLFGEHRHLHPGFFAGTAAIVMANVLHPLLTRGRKSGG